ncbi:unnamed protein product [marine sediment metagenome]|uniref:Uncharacterized protein n=1 Tax=marine sediment metagenome TaxID=412755 RepID=X1ITM5_9ZZZZ
MAKVDYDEESILPSAKIDKLATKKAKLETKAIMRLVEDIELPKILENYLSGKDINRYYKLDYEIKKLFKKCV